MLIYVVVGILVAILTFISILAVLIMDDFSGIPWQLAKTLCVLLLIWMLGYLSFMQYGGLYN